MKTFNCNHCKKDFTVATLQPIVRNHCSKACRTAAARERIPARFCMHCGDEIKMRRGVKSNKKYCSRDHQIKHEMNDKYDTVKDELRQIVKGERIARDIKVKYNFNTHVFNVLMNRYFQELYEKQKLEPGIELKILQGKMFSADEMNYGSPTYRVEDVIKEDNR